MREDRGKEGVREGGKNVSECSTHDQAVLLP